jgi:hypothetical protein
MRRLNSTGIWVFLAMGGIAAIALGQGAGQRQSGGLPPVQQAPSSRSSYPSMGGISPMGTDPAAPPDILSGRIAEQQARSRNNDRQKRLETDTDKLMGLVTDFKQQVQGDKPLSQDDVSKRAEEIEKLARSVKDRMKG